MRSKKEIDNNHWGHNSKQDRLGLVRFYPEAGGRELARAHMEFKKAWESWRQIKSCWYDHQCFGKSDFYWLCLFSYGNPWSWQNHLEYSLMFRMCRVQQSLPAYTGDVLRAGQAMRLREMREAITTVGRLRRFRNVRKLDYSIREPTADKFGGDLFQEC